jgi:Zn-dependent M28 family amino/carboxypeptidase
VAQAPLTAEELEVRERVRKHVDVLGGLIGERNLARFSALEAAAAYVRRAFREVGYEPADHPYDVNGKTCVNIDCEVRGQSRPGEIVLAGAHYDSVFMSPGANDNATGVAAVLEIARLLRGRRLARTVRFVGFVNEEPPYFQTQEMGSLVYARMCRARGDDIVAMFTPETIGCYTDAPGSQRYPIRIPFPLSLWFPKIGNFVMFVGDFASGLLVRRTSRSFRRHSRFRCRAGTFPRTITGVGFSDHWSFWQAGYPAIMITDTAPFRYEHYHTPQDTPDKIDYDRTARVALGLAEMTADLAGREH